MVRARASRPVPKLRWMVHFPITEGTLVGTPSSSLSLPPSDPLVPTKSLGVATLPTTVTRSPALLVPTGRTGGLVMGTLPPSPDTMCGRLATLLVFSTGLPRLLFLTKRTVGPWKVTPWLDT